MAKRKRGDGSLHLRKDGRWEGRMVIGYDEKGLPKTKNVLAKTKTECVAKLEGPAGETDGSRPLKFPKSVSPWGTGWSTGTRTTKK